MLGIVLSLVTRANGIGGERGILALRPGVPDRPGALVAADFNLDGKLDLLQANFEAGDLSLFQQDAAGNYVERTPSPVLALDGPTFMAVADLNRDGRPDVVTVNRLARQVTIRLSDPDLTLKAEPSLVVGRVPQAVAIADFNGDSRPDLAVTSEFDDLIYIFVGRGDGTFSFARTVDTRTAARKASNTPTGAYGIVTGDFNRDGRADLAAALYCTDEVAILLGNGNGTFQLTPTLAVGRHPTYLSVARLTDDQLPGNTDDFQDLVVLLSGGQQSAPDDCQKLSGTSLPGGIAPLLGNGDGTFSPATPVTASPADAPLQFAVGQLRLGAAGFDDLVVANFGTSTLALYPASGTGGFLAPTLLGGASSTLSNPNAVALLDRDGDGFVDRIAATNYSGDSLTLFDGGGVNPFVELPVSPLTATRNPEGLSIGSLDSGGVEDLAVLSSGNTSLQTFSSMNSGFFFKRRQTPLPSGCGPTAMTLADFDRDGSLDAAIALADSDGSDGPSTSPGLALLRGNGVGSFGSTAGRCTGGSAAGSSCTSDAFCPGGVCSYSFSLGFCSSGTNLGKACTVDGDCPASVCVLPLSGAGLSGTASVLLASDLNSLDADRDGVVNSVDNCPSRYNPGQENTRGKTCLLGTNNLQPCTTDTDCPGGTCSRLDTRGDACDSTATTAGPCPAPGDCDQDGVVDLNDNCDDVYNPSQVDLDKNLVGDACDHDPDLAILEPSLSQVEVLMRLSGGTGFDAPTVVPLAGVPQGLDSGNLTAGDSFRDLVVTLPAQGAFQILKGDGTGGFTPLSPFLLGGSPGALAVLEANSLDLDLDGVPNSTDNCPTRYNPTQVDTDRDGAGDACSRVDNPDGDTAVTLLARRGDNCPDVYNLFQTDTDGDGIGDACDNNPTVYNPADDQDLDGVPNSTDNCPTRYNPTQSNFNTDSVGDACAQATDPDGDGIPTATISRDNCPDVYNSDQADSDGDGIGDACENLSDLAVADAAAGTLQLVIESPSGAWLPQVPAYPVGSQPTSVLAVDLNGDHITDLVVANTGSSTLTVLLGIGDGTFLSDPSFQVPVLSGPTNLQAGFLRNDPVLDFAEVAMLSPSRNTPVIAVNILSERADIDGSGEVNGRDLAFWAKGFGLTRKDAAYPSPPSADINLDGKIDGLDLVFLTAQFGKVVAPPPASP